MKSEDDRVCNECKELLSIENYYRYQHWSHRAICKSCTSKEYRQKYSLKKSKQKPEEKYKDVYKYPPIPVVVKEKWEDDTVVSNCWPIKCRFFA
jgi:hypothetical protein